MCYARQFVHEYFIRTKPNKFLKGKTTMIEVDKTWGWEKWFANNDLYCGKCLYVRTGEWSSSGNFHYHEIKDETFFVVTGILHVEYVIEKDEDITIKTLLLKEGDSFRVKPGVKHRFTSVEGLGCKFIEASTTHRNEDSFRCFWDEKGHKWVIV